MPHRLVKHLSHCFPFATTADEPDTVALTGRSSPDPLEPLHEPMTFRRQLEECLAVMREWPVSGPGAGPVVARLRQMGQALTDMEPRGSRMSRPAALQLQAWLGAMEEAQCSWARMECVRGGELLSLASRITVPQHPELAMALLEQLSLARRSDAAAREAFGRGHWRQAEQHDQRARVHCDVVRSLKACVEFGNDAERQTVLALLADGQGSADFSAVRAFELSGADRRASFRRPVRGISIGQDSLASSGPGSLSPSEAGLPGRLDRSGFCAALQDVRHQLRRCRRAQPLVQQAQRSLQLLEASGPRSRDGDVDPPMMEALQRLQQQAAVAVTLESAAQSVLSAGGRLRAALAACPPALGELAEALSYRDVALRAYAETADRALAEGDMLGLSIAVAHGGSLASATLELLARTGAPELPDVLWQIEQRHMHQGAVQALQAAAGRGAPVMEEGLRHVSQLLERFDRAPSEQAAAGLLYDVDMVMGLLRSTAAGA